MPKSSRQATDDLEAVRLPEVNRRLIGADDEVELHRPETGSSRRRKRMFAHRPRDTVAAMGRGDEIAGVGDVIAEPHLVWVEHVRSDDLLVDEGHKDA